MIRVGEGFWAGGEGMTQLGSECGRRRRRGVREEGEEEEEEGGVEGRGLIAWRGRGR